MIKLYVSRTAGNVWMKTEQEHMKSVLESKKIVYEEIDVGDPHKVKDKQFMQKSLKLNDDDLVALPPQLFNGETHRGDYEGFFKAIECEHLFEYLDLEVPQHEVEYQIKQQEETSRTV